MNINIKTVRDLWTDDIEEEIWDKHREEVLKQINKIEKLPIDAIKKETYCNEKKTLISITIPELKTTFILPYWKRDQDKVRCLPWSR